MAPIQSKMDPWKVTNSDNDEAINGDTGDCAPPRSENVELAFNDHFKPFEKLPDSSEYLASLENKLKKVQRGALKGDNLSSNSVIRSLEETRESYMVQLLADSVNQPGEVDSLDELKVNPILKKLAPEKQAIAVEELVHLVKADQLALLLDSDAPEEEQNLSSEPELLPASPQNQEDSTTEL